MSRCLGLGINGSPSRQGCLGLFHSQFRQIFFLIVLDQKPAKSICLLWSWISSASKPHKYTVLGLLASTKWDFFITQVQGVFVTKMKTLFLYLLIKNCQSLFSPEIKHGDTLISTLFIYQFLGFTKLLF
jgi:hypothetical protein